MTRTWEAPSSPRVRNFTVALGVGVAIELGIGAGGLLPFADEDRFKRTQGVSRVPERFHPHDLEASELRLTDQLDVGEQRAVAAQPALRAPSIREQRCHGWTLERTRAATCSATCVAAQPQPR